MFRKLSLLGLVVFIFLAAISVSYAQDEKPEDGIYSAIFTTDSTMFNVCEAYDGRGTLTVKDGRMTVHITLASKKITRLFFGKAEDAKKDGAKLIEPTVDSVTYSDGITEEAYGFDVPVPYLNDPFDCAILGSKDNWYDHKVTVSDPEPLK